MKVLSLFDGMSCGRLALDRAGLSVEEYYSSEVDKYAIAVAKKNFPDIVLLGDVQRWREWGLDFSSVDLLIGGSPCQGFSFAGKQLNFEDERSRLFFEYVDILNEIRSKNPKVFFLLENVRMKKEYQAIISERLGVGPLEIDSALVSAQHRKRLYWTNIPGVGLPRDRGIFLKDIVYENANLDYAIGESWAKWFKEKAEYLLEKKYAQLGAEKAITMTARQYASWNGNFVYECLEEYVVPFDRTLKLLDKEVERGKIGYFNVDSQSKRVYYIFGCITPDWMNKGQAENGQRFNDGEKFYTLVSKSRHGILTEGYIRRLTPIECERLQTLPDEYTSAEINGRKISDAQRYKMLGNGWTVDVISHILRHLR